MRSSAPLRRSTTIAGILGLVLLTVAAGGCGKGRGAPPGQVQNATGYNPASGQVHTPSPGVDLKLKVK